MANFIPLILFTILTNFFSQIMLKKGMTDLPLGIFWFGYDGGEHGLALVGAVSG